MDGYATAVDIGKPLFEDTNGRSKTMLGTQQVGIRNINGSNARDTGCVEMFHREGIVPIGSGHVTLLLAQLRPIHIEVGQPAKVTSGIHPLQVGEGCFGPTGQAVKHQIVLQRIHRPVEQRHFLPAFTGNAHRVFCITQAGGVLALEIDS